MSGYKVNKSQFIEVLENNVACLPDVELAKQLNITPVHFSRLKKQYQHEIKDASRELTRRIVLEQVQNLRRNSNKGDTAAAKYLIEMSQTLDLEQAVVEMKKDIETIKAKQAEQVERAEMGLVRKAVNQ